MASGNMLGSRYLFFPANEAVELVHVCVFQFHAGVDVTVERDINVGVS